MITLFIIWYLIGIFGVWCMFHSARKEWYMKFKCEYWGDPHETALTFLIIISPAMALGGVFNILLSFVLSKEYFTVYFKIPKNSE